MVRAFVSSPFSSGSGEGLTLWRRTDWSLRGEGWGIHPRALRKKISSNRGRAFSEPSLFVWPFRYFAQCRVFDAFSQRQRASTSLQNTLMGRHRLQEPRAEVFDP